RKTRRRRCVRCSRDEAAELTGLSRLHGLATDSRGDLYVADSGHHRIAVDARDCKVPRPFSTSRAKCKGRRQLQQRQARCRDKFRRLRVRQRDLLHRPRRRIAVVVDRPIAPAGRHCSNADGVSQARGALSAPVARVTRLRLPFPS
ncbi:MAG: hypothetical protein IAI50_13570, partial [Candidatus Eremiobacteraeota bacterium]|nr:hypothetical protein [Candidatus Eremiobacteraeota bacterium]